MQRIRSEMKKLTARTRLVDDITNRVATRNGAPGTATAILGPFWRADTPVRSNGSSIVLKCPADGEVAWMHGRVTCSNTGKPLANASVDVWQASTNGKGVTTETDRRRRGGSDELN